MSTPVAFYFTVANTNATQPDEVLRFLQDGSPDVRAFRRLPPMDGRPQADTFQWAVVLGAVGSVASIASLLWQAYDKFIASRKTEKDSAGIIVHVTPTLGSPVQFWIGGTHKNREEFVAEFTEQISDIQSFPVDSEYAQAVDHLLSNPNLIPLDEYLRDRTMG